MQLEQQRVHSLQGLPVSGLPTTLRGGTGTLGSGIGASGLVVGSLLGAGGCSGIHNVDKDGGELLQQ